MDVVDKLSFLNIVGVDYNLFYNRKRKCFVLRKPYMVPQNAKTLVEMPYRKTCQSLAWRYFWPMLNEEEKALADAFEEKHGFFDYMRETGLISVYDEAMERAVTQVLDRWESENGLSIDWQTAYIDS